MNDPLVKIKDSQKLIDDLLVDHWNYHEAKLLWNKGRDAFYLLVLRKQTRNPDPDPDLQKKRVVALDPGGRHFQKYIDMTTGTNGDLLDRYCPAEERPEWNRTVQAELKRRLGRIKRLRASLEFDFLKAAEERFQEMVYYQSRAAGPGCHFSEAELQKIRRNAIKLEGRRRRERRRLIERLWIHLHGLRLNMHYNACASLWDRWDVVIAGNTNFVELLENRKAYVSPEQREQLLSWNHGKFRRRLESSAFKRAGKYMCEITEDYSTQYCGLCGTLNPGVGSATIYQCINPACSIRTDRDVNGARNIGLYFVTQQAKRTGRQ